jgi:hypothetical protein
MSEKSVADGIKLKQEDTSFGHDAMEAAKKAPIVGKGIGTVTSAYNNFSGAGGAGDVALASADLIKDGAGFVAGAGMDMASFALDPVGWLVSNGLNMLLELIQPMQDALHFVTGDGPALKDAAGNFGTIGAGFVTLADDFVQAGDEALQGWEGGGGEAAKKALGDFAQGIKGIGASSASVAETLQMWSMVMTVIEEVIKAIITELVSWLIYLWLPALAASIVSLGSSVAGAMAASVAKAASVFGKITAHLGKLGKLLDKFMGFLLKWTDDLVKQGSKLTAGGARIMPGEEKAISGLLGKSEGVGFRLKATGDVALETLKGAPKEAFKAVAGFNPDDVLTKGSAYAGKAVLDGASKMYETTKDVYAAGKADNGESDQETRENLDLDR